MIRGESFVYPFLRCYNISMDNEESRTCPVNIRCSESTASWLALFIGLIATVSIRLVNFVLDINVIWAKALWYIGVGGFFLYFLYKFTQNRRLQRELSRLDLVRKLSCGEKLGDVDAATLRGILCQLNSKDNVINYFVIFASSAVVLVIGIIQDLILR